MSQTRYQPFVTYIKVNLSQNDHDLLQQISDAHLHESLAQSVRYLIRREAANLANPVATAMRERLENPPRPPLVALESPSPWALKQQKLDVVDVWDMGRVVHMLVCGVCGHRWPMEYDENGRITNLACPKEESHARDGD